MKKILLFQFFLLFFISCGSDKVEFPKKLIALSENSIKISEPIDYIAFRLYTNSGINGNHGNFYLFEDDTYLTDAHPFYSLRPSLYTLSEGAYADIKRSLIKFMLVDYSNYIEKGLVKPMRVCSHSSTHSIEFMHEGQVVNIFSNSCYPNNKILELYDLKLNLKGFKKSYRVVEYEVPK